ncbi:hypothetical protein BCCGELA001_28615 [Bradyrhizobium sp. CCGE-LA001]|nr:hypothetical protein BCCGELA001_28615 [Bradyrhizobium sp. CCGE-LA001]
MDRSCRVNDCVDREVSKCGLAKKIVSTSLFQMMKNGLPHRSLRSYDAQFTFDCGLESRRKIGGQG